MEYGTRALIFDEHTELGETIDGFTKVQGINFYIIPGKGEILGSWDSREEGRDIYREVIQTELEKNKDKKGYQSLRSLTMEPQPGNLIFALLKREGRPLVALV